MPLLSYDREVTGRETILDSHQSRQPTQYTPYTAFWNVGNVSRPWQHWGCSGQSPHGYSGAPLPGHKPAGLRFSNPHLPRRSQSPFQKHGRPLPLHCRGIVVEAGSRVGVFTEGLRGVCRLGFGFPPEWPCRCVLASHDLCSCRWARLGYVSMD